MWWHLWETVDGIKSYKHELSNSHTWTCRCFGDWQISDKMIQVGKHLVGEGEPSIWERDGGGKIIQTILKLKFPFLSLYWLSALFTWVIFQTTFMWFSSSAVWPATSLAGTLVNGPAPEEGSTNVYQDPLFCCCTDIITTGHDFQTTFYMWWSHDSGPRCDQWLVLWGPWSMVQNWGRG